MAHHGARNSADIVELMSESSDDTDRDNHQKFHHWNRPWYHPEVSGRDLVHRPHRHSHVVEPRRAQSHITPRRHISLRQPFEVPRSPVRVHRSTSRGRSIHVDVVNNVTDQAVFEDTQSIHSPSRSPSPSVSLRRSTRHVHHSPHRIEISAEVAAPWNTNYPYPYQYPNPLRAWQQFRNSNGMEMYANNRATATAIAGDFRSRSHFPHHQPHRRYSTSPHWAPHIPPKEEERKLVIADVEREQNKVEAAKEVAVKEWRLKQREEEDARKAAIEKWRLEEKEKEEAKQHVIDDALREQREKDVKKKKEEDDIKKKIEVEQVEKKKKEEDEKKKKEEDIKAAIRDRMAKAGYHNEDIEATIEAKKTNYCHTHNRTHPCHLCIKTSTTTSSQTTSMEPFGFPLRKVRRDLVSTETLRIYGLDWDYDADDADLIIIRSDPATWDPEELYRHSRKHYEYDWYKRMWTKRTWVERRRGRSPSSRLVLVRERR